MRVPTAGLGPRSQKRTWRKLFVDLFHIIIIEDLVVAEGRHAAQVIRTLLLHDAQELLQLFGDVRSNCRFVATVRRGYDVRHFAEEEVSADPLEHFLQRSCGGGIAGEDSVYPGRAGPES